MRKYILAIAVVMTASTSFGQITITSANIGDPGDSYLMAYDNEIPPHVQPGPAGPAQTWDFSALTADEIDTVLFLHPDSTPYAGFFPGTNLAISQNDEEMWGFMAKNMLELSILGAVISVPELGVMPVVLEPKDIMADFPVNYLDSLEHSFKVDVSIASPEPGIDSIRYKSTTFKTSKTDAWGTMNLPMGSYDVLRVNEQRVMVDSVWTKLLWFWVFISRTVDTIEMYYWWSDAPEAGFYLASMDVEPGTTQINTLSFMHNPEVGIYERNDFDVRVYPVPVKDHLFLELPSAISVNLRIMNAAGQLVRIGSWENENKIRVNTEDLQAGMYFYVLKDESGRFLQSGKFLKTR